MQLIDSHCHINFDSLAGDIAGVLSRAEENGIFGMLCVCVNFEDYPQIRQLASAHPHIFASVGVHPTYTECFEPDLEDIVQLSTEDKVIAIGETGLDYFRNDGDLTWQRDRFQRHIEASRITGKPLIIHTRQAADDTMDMLENGQAEESGGVMHCFAEDWSTAKRALDIGFYISFSGIVTFKSADTLREVAKKTPLDRILVETDSPYLAPVPHRGKTNEPSFVRHTAEFIADLKGIDRKILAEQTTRNFFDLFPGAAPLKARWNEAA